MYLTNGSICKLT